MGLCTSIIHEKVSPIQICVDKIQPFTLSNAFQNTVGIHQAWRLAESKGEGALTGWMWWDGVSNWLHITLLHFVFWSPKLSQCLLFTPILWRVTSIKTCFKNKQYMNFEKGMLCHCSPYTLLHCVPSTIIHCFPNHYLWQVQPKTGFNKALSMMNLEETLEEGASDGRHPPCKKPRRTKQTLEGLDSPDVVGDQTDSCHYVLTDNLSAFLFQKQKSQIWFHDCCFLFCLVKFPRKFKQGIFDLVVRMNAKICTSIFSKKGRYLKSDCYSFLFDEKSTGKNARRCIYTIMISVGIWNSVIKLLEALFVSFTISGLDISEQTGTYTFQRSYISTYPYRFTCPYLPSYMHRYTNIRTHIQGLHILLYIHIYI